SDLQQSVEERPVASQRDAKVLRRRFLALVPLLLQARAGLVEAARQLRHQVRDELVGPLDRFPRLVDETGLHFLPARAQPLELVLVEELLVLLLLGLLVFALLLRLL